MLLNRPGRIVLVQRLLYVLLSLVAASFLRASDDIQFNRDVRPILSENCFACHGHDKSQRKAKLRLDDRDTAIERGAKHEGITALIVDMELPGIEVNVIRDITGGELFCEVAFDNARVPAAYRLGEENLGWKVAMGTLGHERVGTAGLSVSMRIELDNLIATARIHNPDALADPGIRDRIARLWTQLELTRLLNARALSKILKGLPNWPEVPLAKLQWSSLSQTIAELGVDILGPLGVLEKGGPDAVDKGHWSRNYVWQRYTSIGAGTTEVQKNIIADRAIKMPRR